MIAPYLSNLYQAVSWPRLEKYRPANGTDLAMVSTYCWNVELAEALYPALAALEVTLRNSIHHNLAARENNDFWFWNVLRPEDIPAFNDKVDGLRSRHRQSPTAGQIVAEQSFSFWTMLLGKNYNQRIWTKNHAALIRSTFPYLPPTPNARRFLERHYRLLKVLRNRVMHHEPIWRGVYWNAHRYPLPDLYVRILEGIAWISPAMRDTLQISDRFTHVHQSGKTRIESEIRDRFGIA